MTFIILLSFLKTRKTKTSQPRKSTDALAPDIESRGHASTSQGTVDKHPGSLSLNCLPSGMSVAISHFLVFAVEPTYLFF